MRVVALCCGNNGVKGGKGDGQGMFDGFPCGKCKQIQKITRSHASRKSNGLNLNSRNLKLKNCVHAKQVVALCYGSIGVKGVR